MLQMLLNVMQLKVFDLEMGRTLACCSVMIKLSDFQSYNGMRPYKFVSKLNHIRPGDAGYES
jgi:hypothetical protein